MNFLHAEIGSAKDNLKSPIHNWYKFTAGFSYRFVEEILQLEGLLENHDSLVFDPFAGCGTTLVSCQKKGVSAVGNEGQDFMHGIIQAKLFWNLKRPTFSRHLKNLENKIRNSSTEVNLDTEAHELLRTLYNDSVLKELCLLREQIESIKSKNYRLFFKLALSQTLHKVSIHPIAIPYIVRSKTRSIQEDVWKTFSNACQQMMLDIENNYLKHPTSKIYKHDSRERNTKLVDGACNLCITSPPYLNNLDYGEISKVHTHFFGITNSWNDITEDVRKKLVTGATTHYAQSEFTLDSFLTSDFALENQNLIGMLSSKYYEIKNVAKERAGKKSFDILMLYYFRDMFYVLREIRRVLSPNSRAYLILGDSAPYGVYVPTTEWLGQIGMNSGFDSFEIHKIRSRGGKWKSLTHRHNKELTENVLILQ